MLRAYVAAGFPPAVFWGLTPRLYLCQMRGAADRVEQEHKDRAWLAWHVESLHRVEKLPEAAAFINGKAGKVEPGGDTAMRLALLRAALPKITKEEWAERRAKAV